MDPATLYILLHYANGYERVITLQPGGMADCEARFSEIERKKPDRFEVAKHVCWPQEKSPPDWVAARPIVGVPVLQQDLLR